MEAPAEKKKGRPRGPARVRSSYQVDTKGLCFLCLRQRQRCSNKKQREETSLQFCKILMRYLKIDFHRSVVKPSHFKWRRSDKVKTIGVELCEDCSLLASSFNAIYCEIEVLQMKLNAYLKTISDIMSLALRIPSRMKEFQERLGFRAKVLEDTPSTSTNTKKPHSIPKPALLVQNFRKELIQRANDKRKKLIPRVRLTKSVGVLNCTSAQAIAPSKKATISKTALSPIQTELRNYMIAYTFSLVAVWLLTTESSFESRNTPVASSSSAISRNVEDMPLVESCKTFAGSNDKAQTAGGQHQFTITDSGKTVLLPHQSFKTEEAFVDESIMEYEDTTAELIDISDDGFFAEASNLVNEINMSTDDTDPPELLEVVKQEPQESPLEVNERTCKECRIHLSCRAELEKHRSVIHKVTNHAQCPVCKNMFSGYHFLKRHRKDSVDCALDEATEALEFTTIAKPLFPFSSTVRGNRFCPMEGCFEVFHKPEFLQLHLKAHGLFTCSHFTCNDKFEKAHDLALHESKQHSGSQFSGYKCIRCNFHVGGQYQYVLHFLGEHLNINVFNEQCDICQKGFMSGGGRHSQLQNAKEVHFRTHHDVTGKDPQSIIKCDVDNCKAYFVKKAQLLAHKTHIHHIEQEAKLSCSICGEKVLNQGIMLRHKLEAHSNLPSHEIEAHLKRVRVIPKRGKYKCDYCGEQYASKYSLLMHSKNHDHLKNAIEGDDEEEDTEKTKESQPESLNVDTEIP